MRLMWNKLVLITSVITCLSFTSRAGCEPTVQSFTIGNVGTIDVLTNTNGMASGGNCGLNFEDDFASCHATLWIGDMLFLSQAFSTCFNGDYSAFDVNLLVDQIYGNVNDAYSAYGPYLGMTISEYAALHEVWSLEITTTLDNFWNLPTAYTGKYFIKNPSGITYDPVLCSSKAYVYSDLILSSPANHFSPYVSFLNSDTFNNDTVYLTQSANGEYQYEYFAYIDGLLSRRPMRIGIEELKTAYFTSTIQTAGIVTPLSSSVLMNNYVYSNGGNLEYYGLGLLQNGTSTYFDPSIANTGNNVVYVRSNNNGCKSDWNDTLFYITPIVTNLQPPNLVASTAFPQTGQGHYLIENTTGTNVISGKFHFACSNKDYTFSIGSPQVGLTYEWQVIYQSFVYETGTGTSFSFTMPDRSAVNLDQMSSVYTPSDHWNTPSLPHNGLMYFGYDLDNSGVVDNDESFISTSLGDQMRLMVRSKNALNNYSNWTTYTIGVVPSPELEDNSILCYDGNPVLNAVTTTPIFNSSLGLNSVRSARWDVNNDGVFEHDGSVDNILQLMTNTNKKNLMQTQIIDSTKYWAWNTTSGQYHEIYLIESGEVCSSVIDTVGVIRKPSLTASFSEVDTIPYGTPVLCVVSGSYFSPENDSIAWNWTDGSPSYGNDSVWHFMNDLGYYSLNLEVFDSLGCQTDSLFFNYWYTPGTLSIEEELDVNLKMYPVPVIDKLIIETTEELDAIRIFNLNGYLVFKGNKKECDLSGLPSSEYIVELEFGNKLIHRQIIKL